MKSSQAVDQPIFSGQGKEEDAEQNCEESLTGEKKHGDPGENQENTQEISHDKQQEGPGGKRPLAPPFLPEFQEVVWSKKADDKRDEQQAEQKGEKGDPGQPAQHIL